MTEYFYQKYGVRLAFHSQLPLVDVSPTKNRPIYVPMELCYIEGHTCSAAQLAASHGRNETPAEVTTAILRVRLLTVFTSLSNRAFCMYAGGGT